MRSFGNQFILKYINSLFILLNKISDSYLNFSSQTRLILELLNYIYWIILRALKKPLSILLKLLKISIPSLKLKNSCQNVLTSHDFLFIRKTKKTRSSCTPAETAITGIGLIYLMCFIRKFEVRYFIYFDFFPPINLMIRLVKKSFWIIA